MKAWFTMLDGQPEAGFSNKESAMIWNAAKQASGLATEVREIDLDDLEIDYEWIDAEPDVGIFEGAAICSATDEDGVDFVDFLDDDQLNSLSENIRGDRQRVKDEESGLY